MPLERDVEKYLIRCVKDAGGDVRKVRWIGRVHAPDRLVLMPGRNCWVELKRPGAEAEDGQAREHERLRKAGCKVFLCDSFNKVNEVIRWLTQ